MKASIKHVMILTGEPSGDFHGGNFIKALAQIDPGIRFSGIGGPCMKACQAHIFFPIEKLSAMGLTEVLFQLRAIQQAFETFKHQVKTRPPDLIVLIDYPGFNLKAAQFAKEKFNIPILYYIPPKVWAWKKSRLKTIQRFVDHVALIFPFEEKLYQKAKISCTYVGNPLMDDFPEHGTKAFLHQPLRDGSAVEPLPGKEWVIGLLPGSRNAEIHHLLGIMVEAAVSIHQQKKNTRFLISAASPSLGEKIHGMLAPHHPEGLFSVVQGRPLEIFKQADLLIAASGTVTLEAALCCLPTLILYKMSLLSYFIGQQVVRVKYAGLANLIAGKELMPELLQEQATPEKISQKAFSMLENLGYHENQLLLVRKLLGRPGASRRTARIALDLLK